MTTNNYANAVVSKQSVYLRDTEDYEKELATSQDDLGGTPSDTQPKENPGADKGEVPWDKRYSDLKSYSDKKLNAKEQEIAALKQQLQDKEAKLKETSSKPVELPVTQAQLDEWRNSYPDFDKIMQTILIQKEQEIISKINSRVEHAENLTKEVLAEKAWAVLLNAHPDAKELNENPEFISWVESQEPEIQSLISSSDPKKISKGLDIYKKFTGRVAKTAKEEAKDASKAVISSSKSELPQEKKIWLESEVLKMHPRTYERYEQEIDQARKEGRFRNDLS